MNKVCAIFVTHNPDLALLDSIRSVQGQVDAMAVIDTTGDEGGLRLLEHSAALPKLHRMHVGPFAEAAALNSGVEYSLAQGCDWVLLLDQFSQISPGHVARMLASLTSHPSPEKVAIILPVNGARIVDARAPGGTQSVVPGSLLRATSVRELGFFDERLFLDCVARDYFLRASQNSLAVVPVPKAEVNYRGPLSRKKFKTNFGYVADDGQTFRPYYWARNRVLLSRRYALGSPMQLLKSVFSAFGESLRILLIEPNKWARLSGLSKGVRDGLVGRTGPAGQFPVKKEKAVEYYSIVRTDIFPLLPPHSPKLIDLGCGAGDTAVAIKRAGKADWICGIETNAQMAQIARGRMDLVIEGDFEKTEVPLGPNSVDTILALDVLEHLVDPWVTIRRLHAILKPGGVIIASIPNVRHLSLVLPLVLFGDWRYQDHGILDSTHLRFFTRKTAIELMTSSGLELEEVRTTGAQPGSLAYIFNRVTFGILRQFVDFQYLIRVRKV